MSDKIPLDRIEPLEINVQIGNYFKMLPNDDTGFTKAVNICVDKFLKNHGTLCGSFEDSIKPYNKAAQDCLRGWRLH